MEAYEGADWVRDLRRRPGRRGPPRPGCSSTSRPIYHPGSTGSVSETALEQGDDELDEDEHGQEPGREDRSQARS